MTDPISRLNAALKSRYRVEREIGEGAMAAVYLAEDLRQERKVALERSTYDIPSLGFSHLGSRLSKFARD